MQARLFVSAILATVLVLGAVACDSPVDGPPPIASITVSPAEGVLEPGQTTALAATLRDAAGKVLQNRDVAWSSSDADIVRVAGNGLATAISAGTARITARSEGREGAATIVVAHPAVASVLVTPAAITLEWNESRQLQAAAFDRQGHPIHGLPVQWTSQDQDIAAVSATGLVEARGSGDAVVSAFIGGRRDDAEVVVRPAPVARIVVTPAVLALEDQEHGQFSARLEDPLGRPLANRPVKWSSSDPAIASINASARVQANRAGRVTITATSEGASGEAAVEIVAPPTRDLLYHRGLPAGGAGIFLLDLAANDAPARLNAGAVSFHPSPSPDGNRFVFAVSQVDDGTGLRVDDLFVVNRNGTGIRRLTSMAGMESEPVWSPNSDRIAFVASNPASRSLDIFVVSADGTGLRSLTAAMGDEIDEVQPAWSQDGNRIAFAAATSPGSGRFRIWTMLADGTGHAPLVTDHGNDLHPTWSPAGDRIAFYRYADGAGQADIMIAAIAGGPALRIALPGDQIEPVWSPDGNHIAFTGRLTPGGQWEISTMRPDGTGVRLRTRDPAWGGGVSPAWIRR